MANAFSNAFVLEADAACQVTAILIWWGAVMDGSARTALVLTAVSMFWRNSRQDVVSCERAKRNTRIFLDTSTHQISELGQCGTLKVAHADGAFTKNSTFPRGTATPDAIAEYEQAPSLLHELLFIATVYFPVYT